MQLDSARELKANLLKQVVSPLGRSPLVRAALALPAGPVTAGPVPTLALGIARQTKQGFVLAVRVQQRVLERSKELDLIRRQARNEVDVRFVGRIDKAAALLFAVVLAIGDGVAYGSPIDAVLRALNVRLLK
jgi:hypothetical protein